MEKKQYYRTDKSIKSINHRKTNKNSLPENQNDLKLPIYLFYIHLTNAVIKLKIFIYIII